MIRVVHLITTLDVGGAEMALLRLVSHLDRRRFLCTVVSIAGPGTLVPQFRAAGIDTHVLSLTRSVGPAAMWRLATLLRQVRPAILQTWMYHADLLGLCVGRLAGVPAIAWNVRCTELDAAHRSCSLRMARSVLPHLSARPEAVVVNSQAGRDTHERLGYAPRRWELIPNGFDTDAFAPSTPLRREVRRELGLPDESLAVGHLARFHPVKDHGTFLAAMGRVAIAVPGVRIVMAGRDVHAGNQELMAQVTAHGLVDKVLAVGEIAAPARLLAALDLVVSSAYAEGFPNVVGEAMATGVPVVATDAGDSAVIVGSTGTVVPTRAPDALADAVIAALRMPAAERASRGLAGRRRVIAEFSLGAVVDRYAALYSGLAADAAAR